MPLVGLRKIFPVFLAKVNRGTQGDQQVGSAGTGEFVQGGQDVVAGDLAQVVVAL
jgi:hypothetical protein